MLLKNLREQVLEANLELVRRGLILYTFGNASGISRQENLVAIKPSGVPYEELKPEDMVITDLEGTIVDGKYRPSSDLPTHLLLYKTFASVGGVAMGAGRPFHSLLRHHPRGLFLRSGTGDR
jgi:L-ribulose-5-phosphate 4-epimerase